jgi:hypothetical protein
LAEDPRTAELGIHVRLAGDRVFVSGEVACADRRARVVEVVHELAPELMIVDDLTVTEASLPGGRADEPEVLR